MAFGTELDLGRLDGDASERDIDALRSAVLEHGYAVLRDQRLTDPALLGLAARLGRIEPRVIKYSTVGPSQRADATAWHHHSHCDGALEDWIVYYTPAVPSHGGALELFDARGWFGALDEADRAWARRRQARHDYTGVAHAGIAPVAEPPWQPLVMARADGGEALYVGAHAVELDDGTPLADPPPGTPWRRIRQAAALPSLYRLHDARAHDVIVWDLRRVAHRGHPWPAAELRVIHEAVIRELAR